MLTAITFISGEHGRRKRGYAGDLTLNYLCGDIDMYTPRKT